MPNHAITKENTHRSYKTIHKKNKTTPPLTLNRKRLGARSRLGKLNLGLAPANQTVENLAASVNPLGELLRDDLVGTLALIETLDQCRALGGAAAHIECPADEGAVLVGVEDGLALEHVLEALLFGL